MASILERHVESLRAAGLLVSAPFASNHAAFPDGVVIGKPASVPGNALLGHEEHWGADGKLLDAPCLWLHSDGRHWFVTSHDNVPGPGPGDFVNVWTTPEEALADVLDFYFGNPDRMEAKRDAQARKRSGIRDGNTRS